MTSKAVLTNCIISISSLIIIIHRTEICGKLEHNRHQRDLKLFSIYVCDEYGIKLHSFH